MLYGEVGFDICITRTTLHDRNISRWQGRYQQEIIVLSPTCNIFENQNFCLTLLSSNDIKKEQGQLTVSHFKSKNTMHKHRCQQGHMRSDLSSSVWFCRHVDGSSYVTSSRGSEGENQNQVSVCLLWWSSLLRSLPLKVRISLKYLFWIFSDVGLSGCLL